VDYQQHEQELKDIITGIAEGGQYYQIGDKQFRRADLVNTFEVLKAIAHQNARLTSNNGWGLATFD